MTKYILFNDTAEVTDKKYWSMEKFPLHEFSWEDTLIDNDPIRLGEFDDKEAALNELKKCENTARKKEGFAHYFWAFNLYWIQEIEIDEDGEEDWSGGEYRAEWEYPEWEKNEYCDYQYYYNDDDEDE